MVITPNSDTSALLIVQILKDLFAIIIIIIIMIGQYLTFILCVCVCIGRYIYQGLIKEWKQVYTKFQ